MRSAGGYLNRVFSVPPNNITMTIPMIAMIARAGIDAMAHFTMNTTIDVKGIRMSVTTSSWVV